jgi:hypothetical protein
MPLGITVLAGLMLWVAPGAIGLLAAIAAACVWSWWLDGHPERPADQSPKR